MCVCFGGSLFVGVCDDSRGSRRRCNVCVGVSFYPRLLRFSPLSLRRSPFAASSSSSFRVAVGDVAVSVILTANGASSPRRKGEGLEMEGEREREQICKRRHQQCNKGENHHNNSRDCSVQQMLHSKREIFSECRHFARSRCPLVVRTRVEGSENKNNWGLRIGWNPIQYL